MSEDISERIENILRDRKSRLPKIEDELREWRQIDEKLVQLRDALDAVVEDSEIGAEFRPLAEDFQHADLRTRVGEVIEKLQIAETRFSRDTVNIGVSGRARVGKSTFLQSITGLGESQIPTGEGEPVTAVRSRITHSEERSYARVEFYEFEAFRREVLQHYHDELGLSGIPKTVREFAEWSYEFDGDEMSVHERSMASRLKQMQDTLSEYRHLIGKGKREIALEDLEPFVSYGTGDQDAKHHAVRDVHIYCQFPHVDVRDLCLIDLPGLGEVAADAEKRHVRGLRNKVDVVLLLKRPRSDQGAYWDEVDDNATQVIDEARGAIERPEDFLVIGSNEGGCSESRVEALLKSLEENVNFDAAEGSHSILRGDAAEPESARADFLTPLLDHLAERLGKMDEDVYSAAQRVASSVRDDIASRLDALRKQLSDINSSASIPEEEILERAKDLQESLAVELSEFVENLYNQARSDREDEEYVDQVESIYEDIETYIDQAFGEGKEEWLRDAYRRMKVAGGSQGVAEEEYNRARVDISEKFSQLDQYFSAQLDDLFNEIGNIVRRETGQLSDGVSAGKDVLKRLPELSEQALEPFPVFAEAAQNLLGLEIEYRAQLHPRVRENLDRLQLVREGDVVDTDPVETTRDGARELLEQLQREAKKAAWETRKSLLEEAGLPELILHAAAEQFVDSLIRSKNSKRDFRKFARSYRDDIWPGTFDTLQLRRNRVNRLNRTLDETIDLVEG